MRIFFLIIILTLSLQSWTKANDISNFEIEGINVDSSLLNYFSKKEIEQNKYFLKQAKGNKKYTKINLEELRDINSYDGLSATFKTSDKKYKITSLEGIIWYQNKNDSCLKKREEIINDLSNLFDENEKYDAGKTVHWAEKNSFTYDYYIFFGNPDNWPIDHILVSCYDWSKDSGFYDHLRLAITSEEYMNWIDELSKN